MISNSPPIIYPDSDGKPMADNTRQAETMVWLKTNLDSLFQDRDDVFVAMDLLWYPVEFHREIRMAPDILVAFGRPKGHRGSYRQWQEEDTPLHVVFEILSPGNRLAEMQGKMDFYEQYGVEEYYIYNPENFDFSGWLLSPAENRLRLIDPLENWVSPRLGVRFDAPGDREWQLYFPDGAPFRSPLEIRRTLERTEQMLENTERMLENVEQERDQERLARQEAEERAARLAARLRELGIEPNGE